MHRGGQAPALRVDAGGATVYRFLMHRGGQAPALRVGAGGHGLQVLDTSRGTGPRATG